MSSPIAHAAVGYAIYSAYSHKLPAKPVIGIPPRLAWPATAVFFSLLPDLDVIAAWLSGNMERYHNNLSHSILFCTLKPAILAPVLKSLTGISIRVGFWFILTSCYLHILVDLFTQGRGLILFWPATTTRFHAPFTAFTGVPWSDSMTSPRYLQMLFEDCSFAVIVIILVAVMRRIRSRYSS